MKRVAGRYRHHRLRARPGFSRRLRRENALDRRDILGRAQPKLRDIVARQIEQRVVHRARRPAGRFCRNAIKNLLQAAGRGIARSRTPHKADAA